MDRLDFCVGEQSLHGLCQPMKAFRLNNDATSSIDLFFLNVFLLIMFGHWTSVESVTLFYLNLLEEMVLFKC